MSKDSKAKNTPILVTSDNGYINQLKVWLAGFRNHNPTRKVIIGHDGTLNTEGVRTDNVEFMVLRKVTTSSSYFPIAHLNAAPLRLFAFDILAEQGVERVIYCDIDTLVRGSVDEMAKYTPAPMVARGEWFEIDYGDPAHGNRLYAQTRTTYWYQRTLNYTYYNDGVMVVNPVMLVEAAKERGYVSIREFYKANCYKYEMIDQDCLNELAPNQITLDPKFNAMPELVQGIISTEEVAKVVREQIESAVIIHWVGIVKPWSVTDDDYVPHSSRYHLPFKEYHELVISIADDLTEEFVNECNCHLKMQEWHVANRPVPTDDGKKQLPAKELPIFF